jgi:secreted Zn-dependent insulinase-like peptidase
MLVTLAARGVKTDRTERIYKVAYSFTEDAGAAFTALKQPQPVAAFALPKANRFMPTTTQLLADGGKAGTAERASTLI